MYANLVMASALAAAPAIPPAPHADYITACIQGGGMAGHAPLGTTTSVDVLQISATTVRFVELSVMAEPGTTTTVTWLPATGTAVNSILFGTTTMAFATKFVKLSPPSNGATSWCVRVR